MTRRDMDRVVEDHVRAARMADQAGFDLLEILEGRPAHDDFVVSDCTVHRLFYSACRIGGERHRGETGGEQKRSRATRARGGVGELHECPLEKRDPADRILLVRKGPLGVWHVRLASQG